MTSRRQGYGPSWPGMYRVLATQALIFVLLSMLGLAVHDDERLSRASVAARSANNVQSFHHPRACGVHLPRNTEQSRRWLQTMSPHCIAAHLSSHFKDIAPAVES